MPTSFPDSIRNFMQADNRGERLKETFWKGWKVTKNFVKETPAYVGAILVVAVVLQFVFPPLAPALFGIAIGFVATRIAVKVIDRHNPMTLDRVMERAEKFRQDNPKFQILTFTAAIVLGPFWGLGRVIAGLGVGGFGALILPYDLAQHRLRIAADKVKGAVDAVSDFVRARI